MIEYFMGNSTDNSMTSSTLSHAGHLNLIILLNYLSVK